MAVSFPRPPTYCPYAKIGDRPNIIVDGAPLRSTVLNLSHWPNNATPAKLKRDTSTATVFAYLDSPEDHTDVPLVSNNHFDEDGLFSMFALCRPEIASDFRERLIDGSMAGDFGVSRTRDSARLCFVIEGFSDPNVSPLPEAVFTGCERQRIAAMYESMLDKLPDVLENIDAYEVFWREQDAHFDRSLRLLDSGEVRIEEIPEVDLAVVYINEELSAEKVRRYLQTELAAVHPFAINTATERSRILCVQGQYLQMQYRYESWLQMVSYRPKPRVDLTNFCSWLNDRETAAGVWLCEPVTEVAPRLLLEGARDSKIPAEEFIDALSNYLPSAPVAWDPYNWTE
jgi:hypothetical protein